MMVCYNRNSDHICAFDNILEKITYLNIFIVGYCENRGKRVKNCNIFHLVMKNSTK